MNLNGQVTILLVDDDPENIWQLVENLEDEYQILSTTNPKKAIDIIKSKLPDIIMLDIIMPEMNGFEILKYIKSDDSTKDIPVIFLTGKSDSIDETKGLEQGAQDYITKPFSIPVVKARIKSILNLKKEMEKRKVIKDHLLIINRELEAQVLNKQNELEQAKKALTSYEEKYSHLFKQKNFINGKKKVLVVDDNPENIHILAENLESDYEVIHATSGKKALNIAFSDNKPDIILLDIMMPEIDGFEVCSKLKANSDTWEIPVIFVTSLNQDISETKGLELGAVDFITKPFSIPVVKARLKTHLNLKNELDRRMYLTRELESLNKNMEEKIKEKTGQLKQAYEDLKNSEEKYRNIFENAIEGIFQSTQDGRYMNASPSMARTLGYDSPKDLILNTENISDQIYVDPNQRNTFTEILEKNGEILNFEFKFKKKNGEQKWGNVCARSIYDTNGKIKYYQGFLNDITKQKEAELENIELEKRLQKTQRLESIGILAEGIAHDFNNILSGILGFSQLAKIHMNNHVKVESDIDNIIKSANKAADLVQQILTFSRKTLNKKRPVSFKNIVNEALNLMRSSIPSTIEITQNIQTDEYILADPTQIHQVIMNLCTNAYHAMDKTGGKLLIELKKTKKNDIVNKRKKDFLELTIKDTGYGIPDDIIEKIFDPYFTTKEPGKGTGLGLAVVHGIIEAHDGFIKVSSIPNRGSLFKIFLPETDKKSNTDKTEKQEEAPETGSGSVMVVDDEEVIIESTKSLLENFGYKVEIFSNGLDAFNEFSKNPLKYDVVVTDMTMPGLTGDNLASKIHEIRPDIQVILCSGYSEKKADEKIAEKRSTIFLQKPFNINELITLIKKTGKKL